MNGSIQVIKIGGSFLRSASSLENLHSVVSSHPGSILVLSAFSGVTDRLHAIHSLNGEDRFGPFVELIQYHVDILNTALWNGNYAFGPNDVQGRLSTAFHDYDGMLRFIQTADYDEFLSVGERLSAAVASVYLNARGITNRMIPSDELGVMIRSDGRTYYVDIEETRPNVLSVISNLSESEETVITTGFFGKDSSGRIRLLGRNSSDYSAVAIAAAIRSERVILLKDVKGIYAQDPKHDPGLYHIPILSYSEALEICKSGSRIIHPLAIELACQHGIELKIGRYDDPEGGSTVCNLDRDQ